MRSWANLCFEGKWEAAKTGDKIPGPVTIRALNAYIEVEDGQAARVGSVRHTRRHNAIVETWVTFRLVKS